MPLPWITLHFGTSRQHSPMAKIQENLLLLSQLSKVLLQPSNQQNNIFLCFIRVLGFTRFFLWYYLSILALVAFVAVLAIYDQKPNPQWVSGSITLNTVMSVTSTVFRLGLVFTLATCISQLSWTWFSKREKPLYHMARFDKASRGAIGSLQLLPVIAFSRHVEHNHVYS